MCVIGPSVEIGADSQLTAHVVIEGPTKIGCHNIVYPFAAIGCAPQHRAHRDEPTTLEIGSHNTIREHVTIHRGTTVGAETTIVGSHCLIMVGAHIAHDVVIGNHVVLTNGTQLGGHVELGDYATAAGCVAVAPFVRIGESAFLAGNAMVERDVPPFLIAAGDRATLRAVNRVGVSNRAIDEASLACLRAAFHALFPLKGHINKLDANDPAADDLCKNPYVKLLVEFLRAPSRKGIAARHKPSAKN